ncbi:MAG TPA: AMP-binding protein, partial [Ktedonobacteraceae bacterium]
QDIETLSEDDIDALLTHAFNRFYQTSSLIGTPETCLKLIERLKEINVDEIACLIDFGVDTESALESLHYLNQVRERSNQDTEMSSPNSTLLDLLTRHRITHMQCTPSLATLLVQEPELLSALRPLRKLLLGGEALSASLVAQLSRALKAQIMNMYGPTETTIWSTTYVPNASDQTIPIGRPLANTQVYILNQHLQPQPINVAGELLIGGAGVARGYLHQPELTSERFITHPFSHENGARVYKTGDRARYRADGEIEFLGRTDQQVKLHGARVELGEIEHMLDQYSAIAQSGVILQEEEPGVPLLVAYLVVRQQQTLSLDDLRKFLSRRLPHYMLPSDFVELPALPLTPNGKIDHRALLARAHPLPREHLTEPRTPLEEMLVHLWSEVLGQRQVGIYDNFFALGGHSLLATQLISRINALLGLAVPLRHLFEAPSVAGFIDHLLETEVELVHDDVLEQALTEAEQFGLARQAIGEKA